MIWALTTRYNTCTSCLDAILIHINENICLRTGKQQFNLKINLIYLDYKRLLSIIGSVHVFTGPTCMAGVNVLFQPKCRIMHTTRAYEVLYELSKKIILSFIISPNEEFGDIVDEMNAKKK